ncbi:hypothetical protein [Pseudorhodobacter aquimaris]|uniref:hypothetical protein n=1 Tax=Pseudorhodobacter aquimaris TaxID=687412 RepID=UPI00067A8E14|nr:hypothetical protein [Pseudorhodobacter aquimaris]
MIGRGAAAALLALTACGPVSVEQAERQCLGRAYSTTGPHGEMGVGVNSEGNALARFKMGVTSDYLMGRDPSAVFDQCVYQKSGQPPSQPLYSRSDWKG